MNTYILMTKLSPETSKQMKERAKLGRAWLDQVREKCPEVKFIAHYALLGPYDSLHEFPEIDRGNLGKLIAGPSAVEAVCNFQPNFH